ncbi:DNA double-strand break repair nuclease NurA [Alkalicoccobacillus porphyridii]|uniref:DNA double-strand break repair nuclease NurA n=1 Tax=Alkalicoccobacillus porphyridii TaxID=2597270 RepID=A0A553ZUB6_9BACI|nr:DNA double-strand break repair nuclease NurA [Alkalicoccobacillus porphyridii]TSB45080.1 DNA double-strand break repair nuclease NurA [Alkalicoccobacillus porphyridii]
MDIEHKIVEKLINVGEKLRNQYQKPGSNNDIIRQKLGTSLAVFRQMQQLSKEKLAELLDNKEIAGVDGSVNQTKSEPPHVIYFFQSLAKTTTGHEIRKSDVYVPLLDDMDKEDEKQPINWRSHLLAKLELQAALQLIEERELAYLLMDGALYHYRIDAEEDWERLRQAALDRDVLLIGVSEEITTENLVKLHAFSDYADRAYNYDRDLLFGVLKQGESIYIEEIQHKAGLQSVWARFGSDPQITGFDMLEEQAYRREEISDLLYTITPKDGRGIPLWLDYVDREIRISDKLVDGLIEQYLDAETRHRYFTKKRNQRPY